jgi:NitT/TauT family transport system ATP-binding protein
MGIREEVVMSDSSFLPRLAVQPADGSPAAYPPAVVVRDLTLSFVQRCGTTPLLVLDRLNLVIEPGEFVVLVGTSGCGKTSLLNIVGGFQEPTSGDVLVQGEPVCGPDPRRIFVFQENGVFPWLTVSNNIGFGLTSKRASERQHIVNRFIEMVGLSGFENAYPNQLSGGMRQRVELARALASDPTLIFMDEPFSALDYLTRLKMRSELIRIWQEESMTVLFVTHDIDEAVQLADRVIVLTPRPGRIHEIIPVEIPRPREAYPEACVRKRAQILAAIDSAASCS